jgi:hypothetical protein
VRKIFRAFCAFFVAKFDLCTRFGLETYRQIQQLNRGSYTK